MSNILELITFYNFTLALENGIQPLKMKKIIGILAALVVVSIFAGATYSSKKELYQNHKEFYALDINAQVINVKRSRGTKVYYNSNDFFYADCCRDGYAIENKVLAGDVVNKRGNVLEFYRYGKNGERRTVFKTVVLKPGDSYFDYFFGI